MTIFDKEFWKVGVLVRKGPCGLGPCWWWFISLSIFLITGQNGTGVFDIKCKIQLEERKGQLVNYSCTENCVALCCAVRVTCDVPQCSRGTRENAIYPLFSY